MSSNAHSATPNVIFSIFAFGGMVAHGGFSAISFIYGVERKGFHGNGILVSIAFLAPHTEGFLNS